MTDHLNERARQQFESLSDDERRDVMGEPRWLPYPEAAGAVTEMNRLRTRQRGNRTQGVAILGPYRNGKTMVCDKLMATECHQVRPSYYYQVPTEPSRLEFISGMIKAMGRLPDPARRTIEERRQQLEGLLEEYEPRLFIFDDAHHGFRGPAAKELHTLLRTMGHKWDLSPVLVGDRTLAELLHNDSELRTRLDKTCLLRRWEYGAEFAILLRSMARVMPLRQASDLTETAIAQRIYQLSEGLIGEIVKIVTEAAVLAVGGDERITMAQIDALQYVPLSKRFSLSDLRGLT
jgi:hypothetical protein